MDGTYYEVLDNDLIGYFCYGSSAQVPLGGDLRAYDKDCIDIGLGLKPELCGVVNGNVFVLNAVEYANEKLPIKRYKSIGFEDTMSFIRGEILFLLWNSKRNRKCYGI